MNAAHLANLHAQSGLALRSWSSTEYDALLGDPAVIISGDEHGFAIGHFVLDEAELRMIVIAPDQRGRGRGRIILNQFEAMAQAKGVTSIFLEVGESNQAARALYLGSGYQEIGNRANYYKRTDGKAENALILKKIFSE